MPYNNVAASKGLGIPVIELTDRTKLNVEQSDHKMIWARYTNKASSWS